MRIRRSSRFGMVALLVLIALGCGLNLYIAHTSNFFGQLPEVVQINASDWTSKTRPNMPGGIDWPEVPTKYISTGRVPTRWNYARWLFVDGFLIYIEDPEKYQLHRNDVANETSTLESLVLNEFRYGAPFSVRSTVVVMPEAEWPSGIHTRSLDITYHPLGLILNPILYTLPIWLILMGVRWAFTTCRSRKRARLGVCVGCAYELGELETCPECGRGREGRKRPSPA